MNPKYQLSPEAKAHKKTYYLVNKERFNELSRKYHQTHKQERAIKLLMKRYGITYSELETLYVKQCGRCAICGWFFKTRKQMHIDHNHETGKVRGLLCEDCNHGVGCFRDSSVTCMSAAFYLYS